MIREKNLKKSYLTETKHYRNTSVYVQPNVFICKSKTENNKQRNENYEIKYTLN